MLGDIVNTNAAYLSRKLAELGICVYHQSVVGDSPERLTAALHLALSRADLVITTGGLGPTYDDLTRETVADALGLPLQLNTHVLDGIRDYFARTGRVMTANNERQAMVPRGATVLANTQGTAPGLIVEKDAGSPTVILLPGPPRELEPMFHDTVMPYLRTRTESMLLSKNVSIFGMGESAVESVLRDSMIQGKNPTIAPYCKAGEVRLRVTASASNEEQAERLCQEGVNAILQSEVGAYVYAVTDARAPEATLEACAIDALKRAQKTVACAESCTGGLIAKRLTDIAGSSAVVLGGFVTYTNAMKISLLGVDPRQIAMHTEISTEVAIQMARGARERTGADIGLSSTGMAGPATAQDTHPVGMVFIGISTNDREYALELNLSPQRSRDYIRTLAASHAISHLLVLCTDRKTAPFEKKEKNLMQ